MKIAIIGASGLVGRKMLEILKDKSNEYQIIAYSSSKSAGKIINGHTLIELNDQNIQKVDIALFSAGGDISKIWAPKFIEKGAFVIDNSNAFRRNPSVPLIVPEINPSRINSTTKLISNPNCSTIQIALPLFFINQINQVKKVIISTYQSASGAGQKGLDDLENNNSAKFAHPLKDNLLPQIDVPLETGFTLEEDKMRFELRKILQLPNLMVSATAVRVPIKYCHGASVYVECKSDVDIEKINLALSSATGINLKNNLKAFEYPLPCDAVNTDLVYVGRIRKDLDNKKAFLFWCVADNLRKGASTNAIQIMDIVSKIITKSAD